MKPNKDLLMLAALRKNARMSLTDMSKLTRIPISTLFDRLKLSEGSVIKKHTALLNFGELGYSAIVKIAVKVKKEERELLKGFLVNHQSINSVSKVSSGFDYIVEGIFRDVKEMDDFLERLREKFTIENEQVYFIIEDLKKEGFLSNVDLIRMMQGM